MKKLKLAILTMSCQISDEEMTALNDKFSADYDVELLKNDGRSLDVQVSDLCSKNAKVIVVKDGESVLEPQLLTAPKEMPMKIVVDYQVKEPKPKRFVPQNMGKAIKRAKKPQYKYRRR